MIDACKLSYLHGWICTCDQRQEQILFLTTIYGWTRDGELDIPPLWRAKAEQSLLVAERIKGIPGWLTCKATKGIYLLRSFQLEKLHFLAYILAPDRSKRQHNSSSSSSRVVFSRDAVVIFSCLGEQSKREDQQWRPGVPVPCPLASSSSTSSCTSSSPSSPAGPSTTASTRASTHVSVRFHPISMCSGKGRVVSTSTPRMVRIPMYSGKGSMV